MLELTFTAVLVTVFLLSASYKVAYPDKIPEVLTKLPTFRELGEPLVRILAGAVVGLEASVGVGLIFRFSVTVALWTAILLSLAFAILVAPWYELLGGDCGCSWRWLPMSPVSGLGLVARNSGLASMSAWLLHRRAIQH